ncbi:MAG: hypothetical protein WD271_07740 [Acidimicrobiia bacterium]
MTFDLLDPRNALDPDVDGIWWAAREPLALGGMPRPRNGFPLARLAAARDVSAIVCLAGTEVVYDATALRWQGFELQDLYGALAPADASAEWLRVTEAAVATRELLDDGLGVIVHCAGGTGRTGTVIGAVLVSLGREPNAVAVWLDAVHKLRGRPGWPESPWQTEALRVLA